MADALKIHETPVKKAITPNRFMLSFGTKYAAVHEAIIKAAAADDRDPGEYMVRWLAQHYDPNTAI